jgi:hypothetical protein
VLGAAARVAATGVLIGLCGSIALEKLVRSNIFGTGKIDAFTSAAIVVVLFTVALRHET